MNELMRAQCGNLLFSEEIKHFIEGNSFESWNLIFLFLSMSNKTLYQSNNFMSIETENKNKRV